MKVEARPVAVAGRLRVGLERLAGMIATPLVTSDYIELFDPLRSAAALRGQIVEIRPETTDSATIVIQPGRAWRRHTAGQYVRLGIDIDGVRRWRAYSLTSSPHRTDGRITITVKAIRDGVVSNYLVRRAHVGIVVQLDQATGEFTLPTAAPPKVLFITAGSGITPIMGMLRTAVNDLDDVIVIHSSPTPKDVIFSADLQAMADSGQIRLVVRHTETEGIVTIADLVKLVGDLADRETWACGPAGMLAELEAHWAAEGLNARLHTERFRPIASATGDGGAVSFSASNKTADADGASSLLDVGEAAGVLMPSGCRMGICFGCVLPLREGSVRDLRTGRLTSATEGDGVLIQTCVSAAAGPCTLDR